MFLLKINEYIFTWYIRQQYIYTNFSYIQQIDLPFLTATVNKRLQKNFLKDWFLLLWACKQHIRNISFTYNTYNIHNGNKVNLLTRYICKFCLAASNASSNRQCVEKTTEIIDEIQQCNLFHWGVPQGILKSSSLQQCRDRSRDHPPVVSLSTEGGPRSRLIELN